MRKLTRDDVMKMEAPACVGLLLNKLADYRTFAWVEFRSNPERDAWLCERFRLSVVRDTDGTLVVGRWGYGEFMGDDFVRLPAADLHLAVLRASLLCLLAEDGT